MQVFNKNDKNERGPEYSAGRSLTFNMLCDISKTFLKSHFITIFQKNKPYIPKPNNSTTKY